MSLLARLNGDEEPKIPVHQFWAGMKEIALGEVTVAQFKTYFELTGVDGTDFDWLVGKYTASTDQELFIELLHVIFVLAEVKTPGYANTADITSRINRIA